jgi:hypothetical protein
MRVLNEVVADGSRVGQKLFSPLS